MKLAHQIRKIESLSMSQALKKAWAGSRAPKSALEIVEEYATEYEKENFTSFEVREWENYGKKRLYITCPGVSKKYQRVGYIDLIEGTFNCEVHPTRTSTGKAYNAFLETATCKIA